MSRQVLMGLLASLLGVLPASARDDSGFVYQKRETREATRAATLAQYTLDLEWGPWYVIGPFGNAGRDKHDMVYPPELSVDLDATHAGKGGVETRWRLLEHAGFDRIDLKQFGDDALHEDAIAYLYRECASAADGVYEVEMGSDDGLKMWFNGRLMVDADLYRGLNLSDHVVRLPVVAGRNTMLVKVTQGAGGWEYQMRPRHDSRLMAWLEYKLNLDFPRSPEAKHYRLLTILEPEGVVLEVGGLDVMSDGRPIVTTRRGEAWIVEGAYDDPPFDAEFKRFAFGLHEPLGARWRDDALYVAQRGELTRIEDRDGDDRADRFVTVSDQWGVSGNYHEFAFGPKFDGDGRMWVTLNLGFCGSLGKSIVPWRGWAMIIEPDGTATPICGGLRSPNGLGRGPDGAMFYTDNQGDWVGTNKLSHLAPGDWHGHPGGDRWYAEAGMTPPRGEPDFKPPAVWFPYDRMGRSASDIALDETGGRFGPFGGQLFVGDQYAATVMRVFMERIDDVYQGACFPFRSGLDCGVNRLCFAPDGSLLAGMTNRGWWSFGNRPWGLQRMVYTGLMPFEVLEMRARPEGFELEFTMPVDAATAGDAASYEMECFTYERWEKYGSPEIDRRALRITAVAVSEDRTTLRLAVDGLRAGYVHGLRLAGVRNEAGEPLLHDEAYYTLNVIPAE